MREMGRRGGHGGGGVVSNDGKTPELVVLADIRLQKAYHEGDGSHTNDIFKGGEGWRMERSRGC